MGIIYEKEDLKCEPEDYGALIGAAARYLTCCEERQAEIDRAVFCAILGIARREEQKEYGSGKRTI